MKKVIPLIVCVLLIASLINATFAESDSIQIDNLFQTLLSNIYFWATVGVITIALYNSKRAWDYQQTKK